MPALIRVIGSRFVVHRLWKKVRGYELERISSEYNRTSQGAMSHEPITNNYQGFTLIEIIIAIGIIALISAITLPNFRNFSRGEEVDQAKTALFSDLRIAKSKAEDGIVCPGVPTGIVSIQVAYSIILYQTYYQTKYECINNTVAPPQTITNTQTKNYPTGTGVKIQALTIQSTTTPLPIACTQINGTTIKYYSRSCPAGSTQCKIVDITCGDGTRYTNPNPFVITLTNSQVPPSTKNVTISPGGSIYAD